MKKLFADKYRVITNRLTYWDYSNEGCYFITICTKDREYYFGEIENVTPQEAVLRPTIIGEYVSAEWAKTSLIRADMNLRLGEFVVMPNHFHALIIIGKNVFNDISTKKAEEILKYKNGFSSQSKNLSAIVRGFKAAVTSFAKQQQMPFQWQPGFHEHIVSSNEAYAAISNYILNNPSKWDIDEYR